MGEKYNFNDLLDIVKKLRGEGGCPWDIEQTHQSIKKNLIEEGYELIEAIDSENFEKIADESGDVLLQVVFHAQIGAENGEYYIDDVTDAICRKLIHRHPHVFGDADLKDSEAVLNTWNQIKRDDRGQKTVADDMDGVSKYLPALMRADKIQSKAGKSGYVFNEPAVSADSIFDMISVISGCSDTASAEKYIGKMLFELVSVSRAMGVDPEIALGKHLDSFIKEFSRYEG